MNNPAYRILSPPWPRLEGEVEEIRRDPSAMAGLGITEIVDGYAQIIRLLDEPPIIIGHVDFLSEALGTRA